VALIAITAAALLGAIGCEPQAESRGSDGDADGDSDSDGDGDGDGDGDSDTSPQGDGGPIPMDCSDCPAVGGNLDNMACAIDLCDDGVVTGQTYEAGVTLGTACTLEDTYEAVSHFGSPQNDLAPLLNSSYAMIASGPATGTSHTTWCDNMTGGGTDPWSSESYTMHDVFEWRLTLEAPSLAEAFHFKYVFFSEEYDDWISTQFNDKFYVVLEADSTNDGQPTVINFTNCREPDLYWDFVCEADDEACDQGQKYCYIAINSAFSDCCWYNNCPDGYSSAVGTDISGTGYECSGSTMDGPTYGSSTGWLQTSWPIDGGETFSITFHIHDTSDGVYDSQAIIDSFEFLGYYEQGTSPIE
jgi:hypothetical protein